MRSNSIFEKYATSFYHKNKNLFTSLGDPSVEQFIGEINKIPYDEGLIPVGYEMRPDLVSWVFYRTTDLWWLLLLVNGVSDVFEGFKTNQRIKIPKIL